MGQPHMPITFFYRLALLPDQALPLTCCGNGSQSKQYQSYNFTFLCHDGSCWQSFLLLLPFAPRLSSKVPQNAMYRLLIEPGLQMREICDKNCCERPLSYR
jgi:hypothetical protein